jgi:hypothetical protein
MTQELIKQQAAVIEQMREALEEIRAGKFDDFSYDIARHALTLQPCPEVLAKVKADAVEKAVDAWLQTFVDPEKFLRNYAHRLLKGEV